MSARSQGCRLRPSINRAWVFQDWGCNSRKPRIQILLVLFRLAQACRYPFESPPSVTAYAATIMYVAVSEWLLSVELPVKTSVGARLRVSHGYGLVVNCGTRIGDDVLLRQGVTIGNRETDGRCPVLGNCVEVGAGAIIIGDVSLGDGAVVGAGSVVLDDVMASEVVAGNPARLVGKRCV